MSYLDFNALSTFIYISLISLLVIILLYFRYLSQKIDNTRQSLKHEIKLMENKRVKEEKIEKPVEVNLKALATEVWKMELIYSAISKQLSEGKKRAFEYSLNNLSNHFAKHGVSIKNHQESGQQENIEIVSIS